MRRHTVQNLSVKINEGRQKIPNQLLISMNIEWLLETFILQILYLHERKNLNDLIA